MSFHPKNDGFTLIELLVVIVILGITSSLIAPDMFSVVKRSQAKTELAKIKAIAELGIERSFFSANQLGITFKGNTVVFSQLKHSTEIDSEMLKTIESEFFTFEETHIVINKGHWQGSHLVKITKSPENKLKEFILFEASVMTKYSAINSSGNEVGNSGTDYNEGIK